MSGVGRDMIMGAQDAHKERKELRRLTGGMGVVGGVANRHTN